MSRPDSRYLALAAKSLARELIWFTMCRHEQGEDPNILLFATRRGGSTFAMELIGANRGIRTLNHPFETLSPQLTPAQAAEIPRFYQGQISSLDDNEAERLDNLVHALFGGRVVINAPNRVWQRDVDRVSDRLVFKITDAKPVIGWFSDRFDARIVYLTRHPIPQSLSCIRNNWTLTVDAHLRDPRFVDANLDARALAFAHDTMTTGTALQQFIVNWALENVAPIRQLPDHPDWLHVRYEDCVVRPDATLEMLADRLHLTDVERMHQVLNRPSRSSRMSTESTTNQIAAGRGADVVRSWRGSIERDDERWCNAALETFGIDPELVLPDA